MAASLLSLQRSQPCLTICGPHSVMPVGWHCAASSNGSPGFWQQNFLGFGHRRVSGLCSASPLPCSTATTRLLRPPSVSREWHGAVSGEGGIVPPSVWKGTRLQRPVLPAQRGIAWGAYGSLDCPTSLQAVYHSLTSMQPPLGKGQCLATPGKLQPHSSLFRP
jgi:hypothetical protein